MVKPNRHLLYGGSIRLPRGIVEMAWSTSTVSDITNSINNRELYQSFKTPDQAIQLLKDVCTTFDIQWDATTHTRGDPLDTSVLLYRSVSEHEDSWHPVRSPLDKRHRDVEPGFLHVFISGSGTLTVGHKKLRFKRGDIVLHSPNVPHSVRADSRYCGSVVCTVPMKYAWDKIKSKGVNHELEK